MSKINLPLLFLLLVLWLIGGAWFFNSKLESIGVGEALDCSFPFSAEFENFETNSDKTFYFEKSGWEPTIPSQTLSSLKAIALFLPKNGNRKLVLTGHYLNDEINNSDYDNLGMARAESIKKELMAYGAYKKNIEIRSVQKDELNLACGKIFGAADFLFENKKNTSTASVDAKKEKKESNNETIAKSKTLTEHSTTATIFYKKSQFVPDVDRELDDWFEYLAEYLDDHSKARLVLTGHTDKGKSREKDQNLGKYRARKLRDVLMKYGIEKKRIRTKTKGSSEPLESNKTTKGRDKNRRVIIELIK